jgi:hypothetical protein
VYNTVQLVVSVLEYRQKLASKMYSAQQKMSAQLHTTKRRAAQPANPVAEVRMDILASTASPHAHTQYSAQPSIQSTPAASCCCRKMLMFND